MRDRVAEQQTAHDMATRTVTKGMSVEAYKAERQRQSIRDRIGHLRAGLEAVKTSTSPSLAGYREQITAEIRSLQAELAALETA